MARCDYSTVGSCKPLDANGLYHIWLQAEVHTIKVQGRLKRG
jgi:hypothetical protein